MLICPQCRTSYSSSISGTCYRDGQKLVDYDAFVAAERDPLRGRLIRGVYQITERIGQGGMGTVYRATQVGLRRNVAIKILRPELTGEPDTVARFQREAAATSLLTHPNTVRVYDFGQTEDGLLYLVMELLEGELITEQLVRDGAFEPLHAIRVTQQILRSLAEAHTKGIVHRDLKPDNIFVARVAGHLQPVVKVLDFGIAKIVAPDHRLDQFETQAGTVFGTPRFMSPEQAQGAPLDRRSDLYSVGAMLYQMLTGRAPFTDDDAVVVMAKHIREVPASPREVAPERAIPAGLEAVVMRALAKEPNARFQDALEFDTALEGCVGDAVGTRVAARPAHGGSRAVGRALAWTSGVALLGGAAYVGLHTIPELSLPFSNAAATRRQDGPTITVLQDAEPLAAAKRDASAAQRAVVEPAGASAAAADASLSDAAAPLLSVPSPAVVAIRSEPNGASVYRGGEPLGKTPINLLVQPDEEFVRVELRMPGYQPLAAELTAKDGERLLLLTKEPSKPLLTKPSLRRRPASWPRPITSPAPARDVADGGVTPPPGGAALQKSAPSPSGARVMPVHTTIRDAAPKTPRSQDGGPAASGGPYERFE